MRPISIKSFLLRPRSDLHIVRILIAGCIVLYLAIFAGVYLYAKDHLPLEQMLGYGLTNHHDIVEYKLLAETMIHDGKFALSADAPFETARIPGYPLFLALLLVVFKTTLVAPLFQLAFTAATVAMIYLIGVRYFPRSIAFFAAALYMIDPIVIYTTGVPQSESLFMLLFIGSIYAITTSAKRAWIPFVIAGILLGLSAYVRQASLYLAPIIALLAYTRGVPWKTLLKNTAIFLVTIFCVTAPWMIRNYHHYGHFAFSSLRDWQTYAYNMALFEQVRTGQNYNEIQAKYSEQFGTTDEHLLRQFNYTDKLRPITMEKILDHPFQYAAFHVYKALALFITSGIVNVNYHLYQFGIFEGGVKFGEGAWGMLVQHKWHDAFIQIFSHFPRLAERLLLGLLYLGTWYTACMALWKRQEHAVWIVGAFIMINFYAFMIGPGSDDTRYRMAAEPFVFLLGFYAFYQIGQKLWVRFR